jgi:hypothetical protein
MLKATLVHGNESSVTFTYPFHIVLDSEARDCAITACAQLPISSTGKIARLRIARQLSVDQSPLDLLVKTGRTVRRLIRH